MLSKLHDNCGQLASHAITMYCAKVPVQGVEFMPWAPVRFMPLAWETISDQWHAVGSYTHRPSTMSTYPHFS